MIHEAPTFTVQVQPAGRSFSVAPGESLLEAGLKAGVGLPYGCGDGTCGSCKCRKVSGEVTLGAHQPAALGAQDAREGFILTCVATAHSDVVLESDKVSQEGALPVRKMPSRVSLMHKASHDVMLLKLALPPAGSFDFRAGQYVRIMLGDGVHRSYSIANAPHSKGDVELHIRRMAGGRFTEHVFGEMKEKQILRLEGPWGSFYLREDSDKPIILLASGTGFAPIKAIIDHMHAKGIARPATLYWGGRRPQDLYMENWVAERLARMPQLRYVPVVSDAWPEDGWTGRTGFVHKAVLEDVPDLSGHQVYACGAPVVVAAARAEYTAVGRLPANEFFADAFTSEADKHRPAAGASSAALAATPSPSPQMA